VRIKFKKRNLAVKPAIWFTVDKNLKSFEFENSLPSYQIFMGKNYNDGYKDFIKMPS